MKTFKIVLLACVMATGSFAAGPVASTNPPPCCVKAPMDKEAASDRSLYQLESTWTDDAAQHLKLAALSGRPQVVTMFFASCIYACPILVHDIKRIEAALPAELRGKVGFTLISFDSQRDSPSVLASFRKRHGLDSNWTLLRAEPDDVLELAALLGVKFKKDTTGQFAHSNIITVLNAEGEIVLQQSGLNTDAGPVVAALHGVQGTSSSK